MFAKKSIFATNIMHTTMDEVKGVPYGVASFTEIIKDNKYCRGQDAVSSRIRKYCHGKC
jgi:hypothetical protein